MPLFLDNNVFRALTEKGRSGDPKRFLADVRATGLVPSGEKVSLQLSPSTLLEAIGVVAPAAKLKIEPIPVAKGRTSIPEEKHVAALVAHLLDQAIDFYEHCVEISEVSLQAKANEQRSHTRTESLEFFDICVTHVLDIPEARRHVIAYLAIDTLFKSTFPKSQSAFMHEHFLRLLLSNNELDNSAALFRVIRRIWEILLRDKMRNKPGYNQQNLEKIDRCMSIKNQRDFVDCELVHYLCEGYINGNTRLPVVGFTMDNLDTVATRISVQKAISEQYRRMMAGDETIKRMAKAQGKLVQFTNAGRLGNYVDVSDIKPLS